MTESTPPENAPEEYLVEEGRLFSKSLIWQLQRRYYDALGIDAWGESRIPFSISTSAHIAGAYARVVFGFLRDHAPTLDLSEPVYIVEIGAGSGRLGFNFLKQLSEFYDESALKHLPFTYVLTDLVLKNVEFWEGHPALKPFVEAGRLDFAQFDAVTDTTLTLRHSGKMLAAGALKNPVIVLANYLLDTLPQDLFSIQEGQLYAVETSLYSTQPEPDILDPEIINRLEIVYDRYPISDDFYGDEHAARILRLYRESLGTTILTFPYMALQCVEAFQRFSGGRMLLLAGDKGDHLIDEFRELEIPPIHLHDNGFSMMFNYHALTQYVENLGGMVLTTSMPYVSLNILAFILGAPDITETRQAYRDFIDYNSPDDNFTGMLGFDRKTDAKLVEILAYIRMKRFDTHAFILVYPLLVSKLNTIPAAAIPEVQRLVRRIREYYYHMGEKFNLPFYLGVVLSATRDYAGAITLFEESRAWYGDIPTTLFNLAVSHSNLDRYDKAHEALDKLPAEFASRQEVIDLKAKITQAADVKKQ